MVPRIPDNEEARLEVSVDVLPDVLASIGIGDDEVSIGAEADTRLCIVERGCGGWQVFYRENGSDYGVVRVESEEEACYALLGKMAMLRYGRIAARSELMGDQLVTAGLYGALAGLVGEADAQVGDGEGGAVAGTGVLGFGAEEVGAEHDGGQHEDGGEGEG